MQQSRCDYAPASIRANWARQNTRELMSKDLQLFTASFWLLVLFASGARANIVCTERAGAACVRWSNGISCLRGAGLACTRWSNGLTCAQGGNAACVQWSNGVFCVRGAGSHCSRWSNGSRCAVGGAGSVLNGRATASFKRSDLPLVHWAAEADTPSAIEKGQCGWRTSLPDWTTQWGPINPAQ